MREMPLDKKTEEGATQLFLAIKTFCIKVFMRNSVSSKSIHFALETMLKKHFSKERNMDERNASGQENRGGCNTALPCKSCTPSCPN
jgi:hypothetical protein